jgi:hypothetical protein
MISSFIKKMNMFSVFRMKTRSNGKHIVPNRRIIDEAYRFV